MDLISIAQETEDVTQDMYEDRLQGGDPIKPPTMEGLDESSTQAANTQKGKVATKQDTPPQASHPETIYTSSGAKPGRSPFNRRSAKKPIAADTLSSVVDGLKAVSLPLPVALGIEYMGAEERRCSGLFWAKALWAT